MTTWVLIHGAWHGGWCWERVAPLLAEAGDAVLAPTLSGLGERVTEATPGIGLSTHVDDVVATLVADDLRGVTLVGHSYAGMLLGMVAERAPERVERLVFLDAFVPDDGQCLFDILLPERRVAIERVTREQGDGWRVPAPAPESALLGVTQPDLAGWLRPRLTAQPLLTFSEPVRLTGQWLARPALAYVHCAGMAEPSSFEAFAERLQRAPGWVVRSIDAPHDVMVTHPRELATTLRDLVTQAEKQPAP